MAVKWIKEKTDDSLLCWLHLRWYCLFDKDLRLFLQSICLWSSIIYHLHPLPPFVAFIHPHLHSPPLTIHRRRILLCWLVVVGCCVTGWLLVSRSVSFIIHHSASRLVHSLRRTAHTFVSSPLMLAGCILLLLLQGLWRHCFMLCDLSLACDCDCDLLFDSFLIWFPIMKIEKTNARVIT